MNFEHRRTACMNNLPQGSIAVLFSGQAPMRSADEAYPFSVNRNFYYCTGLDKEEMILALVKNGDHVLSHLFIQPYDEIQAKWVGGRISKEQAKEISKVHFVHEIGEWESFLQRQFTLNRCNCKMMVGLDLWRHTPTQLDTEAHQLAKFIKDRYPAILISDLFEALTLQRMIKSDEEIKLMKHAQEVTSTAIKVMMRHCQPDINETELEGVFDFTLRKQGIRHTAFPTICASGRNATTLHYVANNCFIEEDELVLVDLGATVDYYCADISRTFPATGKFTPRQKQIYDIVLEGQRRVIEAIQPGKTLPQLNQILIDYYQQALQGIGLLEQGKTVRDYYFHNVSHHLGLDTHDVTVPNLPLRAGMVITVEPGLYLEEEGLGIRIEDDILVCEEGCINLSEKLLHTTEEIEAYMNKKGE